MSKTYWLIEAPGHRWLAFKFSAGGGGWSRRSRPRVDKHPTQEKIRFEVTEGARAKR